MPKSRRRLSRKPGISRIDQESTRTHGFFTRVGWHRRRDGSYGPQFRAVCGDVSHGGKRKALRAAEAWVKKAKAAVAKAKRKRAPATKRKRAPATKRKRASTAKRRRAA